MSKSKKSQTQNTKNKEVAMNYIVVTKKNVRISSRKAGEVVKFQRGVDLREVIRAAYRLINGEITVEQTAAGALVLFTEISDNPGVWRAGYEIVEKPDAIVVYPLNITIDVHGRRVGSIRRANWSSRAQQVRGERFAWTAKAVAELLAANGTFCVPIRSAVFAERMVNFIAGLKAAAKEGSEVRRERYWAGAQVRRANSENAGPGSAFSTYRVKRGNVEFTRRLTEKAADALRAQGFEVEPA